MEVTQEMRDAVATEERERALAYQRECNARWAAWRNDLDEKLKASIREIFPDLTDEQFDTLYGLFSDHYYELNR